MIGFSRFLAWVYLLCSVVVGFLVLVNYSTTEINTGGMFSYTREVANPIGIGVGIGLAVQGLIIFCLLILIARIAENTTKVATELGAANELAKDKVTAIKSDDGISKGQLHDVEHECSEAVVDVPVGQLHDAVWSGNCILVKKFIQLGADVSAKR